MNEISNILAGYGIISCLILGAVYFWSLPHMEKSTVSKIFCTALMTNLSVILVFHLLYFMHGFQPLDYRLYVTVVSTAPICYFFFTRDILRLAEGLQKKDAAHFLIIPFIFFLPLKLGILVTFIAGTSYTFYIFFKTLKIRADIPRYRFEKFFFSMFFITNIMVLGLGISVQIFEPIFYYHTYTACISVALILVSSALLVFPELLSDVLLASQTTYAKSKLDNVNVEAKRDELESLMIKDRYYEDEELSLITAAERLEISPQQLSELVNANFGMGFPRYVTQHRIEAAKSLLVEEPKTSVLAISMAAGFKSQSTFYNAFKQQTDLSPVAYRKAHIKVKNT